MVQYEVSTSGTLTQDDLYGYTGPGASAASVTNELASGGSGTTTTTSAGTTTTTSCSSSITAVGSLAEHFGANTLSVSPVTSGDIEVLAVQAQPETAAAVASVSGGGVSTWSKAIAYPGSATEADIEIWWGKITSTGSSTITVTWSGSTPTYRELDAQEFSAGSGATWSVDKTGDASNSTETSYNMASLSPTGTGELYFGMAVVGGAATAGSTSGFSYAVDDNVNLVAYDTNVSASVDPAGSQSGGTGVDSAAVLIEASGSCGGTTTTTTAATTTTTHATTTTTSGGSSSITAVGSLAQHFGANTLSVSPVTSGDIEVLAVQAQPESSAAVASVSGGGVSTWSKAIAYPGSATEADVEIWWGKVTSTGSSTITVTWSGSTPTYRELDAQEFSAGSGATWSLDRTNDASNSTETSYNMASLSPTGTGELYFGMAVVGGAATAGSSSGFTYAVDDNANLVAYDTNVNASVDPAGSQSGGTGVDSAAVLIEASSGGGTTTTTHATTTTTAGTTTTTTGSGAGAATTYMVELTGGVLLEVTGSTETWYYPSLEGGTAAEASSTGAAVGGITLYDPFGNALTSLQADSPDGLAYGFEGKNGIGTDTDAGGIVLMGARLYNPLTGRFLQVDPVFGGSCNAYDYVCQDPLNGTDLNGEVHWGPSKTFVLTFAQALEFDTALIVAGWAGENLGPVAGDLVGQIGGPVGAILDAAVSAGSVVGGVYLKRWASALTNILVATASNDQLDLNKVRFKITVGFGFKSYLFPVATPQMTVQRSACANCRFRSMPT